MVPAVEPVTDAAILSQLNGAPAPAAAPAPVSDPATLAMLNGTPQMEGGWRTPAMVGSGVLKGLTSFAAPFAAAAADPTGTGGGIVSPDRAEQMAGQATTLPGALTDAVQQTGAIDNPSLQPQNRTERLVAAGSEGAGAALPLSVFGGIPGVVRGVAQGFGAGAGGELGAEFFPKHPTIARLLGGLTGGAITGGATSLAERGIRSMAGETTPLTQAYDSLGIRTDLAGDVTGNKTLQGIQAMAGQAPAGGKVVDAAQGTIGDFANAVEKTATTLGPARTIQEAGQGLQADAANWLQHWKNASTKAWSGVDMQIPPATPVDVSGYKNALNAVTNSLAGAKNTADVLQPSMTRQLATALAADAPNDVLPWQAVKGIRTRLGEMLSDPALVADSGTAELKRLYAGLSQDMQGAATAQGPNALAAFNAANNITKGGHYFIDNAISKIVGGPKNLITPEQAASFAMSGTGNGGSRLSLLRQGGLDAGVDNLAAFKLRDMALANAGKQGASGATVSPSTFLTDSNKMSPEAAAALFKNPAAAKDIADLRTVAGNMKATESLANSSHTGSYLATKEATDIFKNAGLGAFSGSAFGPVGAVAGAIGNVAAPFAPGFLGSRLTATPWLTRLMATPTYQQPAGLGLLTTGAAVSPGLLNHGR